MGRRNTKQKRLILETLMEDRCHPTMQELYQKVLKKDDKIGQATVYRNVNQLVEEKKIRRLFLPNDNVRYDVFCENHYHFACKNCGNFFDLYDEHYSELIQSIEKENQVEILDSNFIFTGICKACLEKKK